MKPTLTAQACWARPALLGTLAAPMPLLATPSADGPALGRSGPGPQAQGDRLRRPSRRSRIRLRWHRGPLHRPGARGRPPLPEQRRMAAGGRSRGGQNGGPKRQRRVRDPQGAPAVRGPSQQPGGRRSRPHYEAFRKILEAEKPDVLFTQWPIDNHPDHRAISMLAYDAWLKLEKKFAFYFYEVSNGEDTVQFAPTHYVDITATEPRSSRPATPTPARPRTGTTRCRIWSAGCAGSRAATEWPRGSSATFRARTSGYRWSERRRRSSTAGKGPGSEGAILECREDHHKLSSLMPDIEPEFFWPLLDDYPAGRPSG